MGRAKILAAVLIVFLASASLAAKTPTEDLKASLDQIIALLADKKMDRAERRKVVVARIRMEFDFESMSRFILGPNWQSATEEQRKKFIDLYTRMLEDTYIERIEAYTNEKVKFLSEKQKNDRAMIDTMIVGASTQIPVDYKLWLDKDKWRVYDVTIEGVSLVRNFQESYKQVIRKDGIEGLLVKMEEKLKEMEAGK